MKLFITNKKFFEQEFEDTGNSSYLNSNQIHILAYNQLKKSLAEGNIPLSLTPNYKEDGFALLDFVSRKDDIYFYEYTTTIS